MTRPSWPMGANSFFKAPTAPLTASVMHCRQEVAARKNNRARNRNKLGVWEQLSCSRSRGKNDLRGLQDCCGTIAVIVKIMESLAPQRAI